MAEAGLLAELELVVQLVLVLVHVLQEVQSQGQREWMRKIGVDHNTLGEFGLVTIIVVDTGTNASTGAGLRLLGSATAASSPSAIGTGDGFRKLMGDHEGNG